MSAAAFQLRDLWPLYDLRVRTGDIELRYPTEAELPSFADVIQGGIHPPGEMPFEIPWTQTPPAERNVASYQWWMESRGSWSVDAWTLTLAVFENGRPAGFQDIRGKQFLTFRTVVTGSWLGFAYQGRGIGKLMRQAALALAFDHLGAQVAETEALVDNPASNKVSLGVGYETNGFGLLAPNGVARPTQKFRMTLDGWRARPRPDVKVQGLDRSRGLFGL